MGPVNYSKISLLLSCVLFKEFCNLNFNCPLIFISDIYVSLVSYTHQVAAKGWFVAMVSALVETDNPEQEIKVGLDLLGPIKQK